MGATEMISLTFSDNYEMFFCGHARQGAIAVPIADSANEGETTKNRRFSLEAVRCLGACGLTPVMVVDQDTYSGLSSNKVIELLEKYR